MNNLDAYFIKYTDRLAYIELKEESTNEDLKGISLPIYIEDMKEGIQTGEFASEINLEIILEAMLLNLAIDPNFIYRNQYEKVLKKYLKNIGDYTANKSVNYEEKDKTKALLMARSGYILNSENKYNAYLYARLLWPLAYEDEGEYQNDFVKESLRILQEILKQDEEFKLSYYELGNIYANLG